MDSDEKLAKLRAAHYEFQKQLQAAHQAWMARFAELYPSLADVLQAHHQRYCDKQGRSEELALLLTVEPKLPIEWALQEYGAALASTGTKPVTAATGAASASDARERAAQTKRLRTRRALLDAALQSLLAGKSTRVDDLARTAGVGLTTLYRHFSTKEELLVAAVQDTLSRLSPKP